MNKNDLLQAPTPSPGVHDLDLPSLALRYFVYMRASRRRTIAASVAHPRPRGSRDEAILGPRSITAQEQRLISASSVRLAAESSSISASRALRAPAPPSGQDVLTSGDLLQDVPILAEALDDLLGVGVLLAESASPAFCEKMRGRQPASDFRDRSRSGGSFQTASRFSASRARTPPRRSRVETTAAWSFARREETRTTSSRRCALLSSTCAGSAHPRFSCTSLLGLCSSAPRALRVLLKGWALETPHACHSWHRSVLRVPYRVYMHSVTCSHAPTTSIADGS
jgi:hypothetical protein